MLISVIITTYNRCRHLLPVLDSLANQQLDSSFGFEIIVVDNNSNDQTKEVLAAQIPKWQGRLKYFFEGKKGKSNALNHGVRQAAGDILVFTDDDVIADKGWLMNTIKCFKTFSCDGVGGRVLPVYPPETPQWIKDNGVKLAGAVVIYEYGPDTLALEASMYPFIGANYAFKREMFSECGLFRTDLGPGMPTMGEDTEFTQRLLARGKKLYYCGEALICHPFDPKRMDLGHMARWHISLGRFDAQREVQEGLSFVYFLGVPRYLFKGIAVDFLGIPAHCFNRIKFFNSWRGFFRKVGMIQEYRKISEQKAVH